MSKKHSWIKTIMAMILGIGLLTTSLFAEVIMKDYLSSPEAAKKLNLKSSQWKVEGNEIRSLNAIKTMHTFKFGSQDWSDYEIGFKLKRLQISPKDQHFGIMLRISDKKSIRIYSRGKAILYMADSRHARLGILPKPLQVGSESPWTSFRIVVAGTSMKVFVDGTLIGTIDKLVQASGKISFYAYHLDVAIKDLKVIVTRVGGKSITSNASSKNILHNSSFELCTLDDLPDYWGCSHWGLASPYWATHFEEWQKHFITDKNVAYDGKRSMKIINPKNKNSFGLNLWSVCVKAQKDKKYSLSAYMKSEPAGVKVQFGNLKGGKETVTLSNKWQRYTTTFVKSTNSLYSDMIKIAPMTKGTVWIDAVQLEDGQLSAYQPIKNEQQQLEAEEGNVNKVLTEVPKYRPPYYKQQLTLSGKLTDNIWKKIPKVNFVSISGDKVKDKTEARMWYNDKGIYIGVKCFDRNAGENKCKVTSRDRNVWNDPSLELFIDPQLSRNYYYHLAINQAGVQYDGFCGDMSWNGNWKAVTYTDPAGKYWSAEIFLPFGELGIDPTCGDWWGFNIARENHALGEYSCWSPTHGSFHTPTKFGQINIDRKIQQNYYTGCSDAELKSTSAKSAILAVKLYNNTKQDQIYNLSAQVTDKSNKQIAEFSQSVKLKKGIEKTIELGKANCQAGAKYNLSLNLRSPSSNELYFAGKKSLETPDLIFLQTQYDIYTRENKILTQIQLNAGSKLLAGASLILEVYDSANKKILSQTLHDLQQEIKTEIDIKNLKDGDYVLKANLKTSSETFSASKKISKLPPVKNVAKIDHFSRMVVINGKPFFPFGIALEGNRTAECIKYYAQNGFNSININTSVSEKAYPSIKRILDAAAENNLKVLIQFPLLRTEKLRNQAAKFIEKFKNNPSVLAWFLFDEAFTLKWGKDNYSTIVNGMGKFKKMDPYHLAMTNENSYGLSFLKGNKLDFPGEIVSVDYYAYPPSRSLQLVGTYAKSMEKIGRKDGKPNWMYLFGAGYTFWASRDLTPAEQEFETYLGIINGVTGIHYFADHPKSKSHWAKIKELAREIKELTPILASTVKAPVIKCNTPAIDFMVKKTKDEVYLIAVNNTTAPVNARFDLSHADVANGEVLFEGRKLKINNGVLEDKFNGYQRHVYLLKK